MLKLIHSQLKIGLVLVLSALILAVWVTALLAEQPPAGLWVTDDGSATIATGRCAEGASTLCGVIVGLQDSKEDPVPEHHRKALCGLPIIWDLTWSTQKKRWQGGKILDPLTEKTHNLTLKAKAGKLLLRVYSRVEALGAALTWIKTDVVEGLCPER